MLHVSRYVENIKSTNKRYMVMSDFYVSIRKFHSVCAISTYSAGVSEAETTAIIGTLRRRTAYTALRHLAPLFDSCERPTGFVQRLG